MDNELNIGEVIPDGIGEFFEMGYMGIRDNSYMMLQFGVHLTFGV